MGDLVEITTVPTQSGIFYKITSGSFRFQVKGRQSAGIGLSTSPDSRYYYGYTIWFILAKDGLPRVTVAKNHSECLISPAHNLLSTQEFRDFWIQWHDGFISLGRDFTEDPLIVYKDETFGRKYITFVVYGNSNSNRTLQWRFEMPPIQEQMKLRPVVDGIPKWVQFQAPPLRERKRFRPVSGDGFPKWVAACIQFPEGALIGGYQEEVLYVIRAEHERSLTPGKFIPSQGLGYIPWGGEMHEKTEVEFLCGYDFLWVPSSDGKVPAGAVEAGYSEVNHETLYIGRARYNHYIIPGKVQPSHHCCYIPFDDVEIAIKDYEILVIPKKNVVCQALFPFNSL